LRIKLDVIIPALNEEEAIAATIGDIPVERLREIGYETEIIFVDNGSTDNTIRIAETLGATVVHQPLPGYGNAYHKGFSYASGDIIACGDADHTYPFYDLPRLLSIMEEKQADFITTDRLSNLNPESMKFINMVGNKFLSRLIRVFYRVPIKDTQSGMWVFRKEILGKMFLTSPGMEFTQEIKIEAYRRGVKCLEVPIHYRKRKGETKLKPFRDGIRNLVFMAKSKRHF